VAVPLDGVRHAPDAQTATSCPAATAASAIATARVSPPQVPVAGENTGISNLIVTTLSTRRTRPRTTVAPRLLIICA
jgi:hypothetical protein